MMVATRWIAALWLLLLIVRPSLGQEQDPRFDSADPAKAPLSVPLDRLEQRINGDAAADGIKMGITTEGRILRLDILSVPGSTSVAATQRVILMIARLAKPDYDEMRFSDAGSDLFVIDGTTIRAIGRQFVWGEEGKGQNPIYLMRLFVDALKLPDGSRAAAPFNGSLLGDTSKTLDFLNKQFTPAWVLPHGTVN
jgi:hypothetical protein